MPDVFCAGANIGMLARASHPLKVNFCKLTNETRLEIEDASRAGQRWIAALAGTASGGGYELALACERILLVDDRRAAVSLPELPLLAVLPGTGGLTRLVDKRGVRRDLADVFCTLEEGVRGPRALEWNLVDAIAKPSEFAALLEREIADALAAAPARAERGVELEPLAPAVSAREIAYRHVRVTLDAERRTATIAVAPADAAATRLARGRCGSRASSTTRCCGCASTTPSSASGCCGSRAIRPPRARSTRRSPATAGSRARCARSSAAS